MSCFFKRSLFLSKVVALLVFQANASAAMPSSNEPHPNWSFREVGLIPIQSGGRIKPLDSFARELVLTETGARSFQSWQPLDLIFSWLTSPVAWEGRAFLQIQREDVRRQLLMDEKRSRFSPKEIFHDSALLQYVDAASAPVPPGTKLSARDQELRHLLERLGIYRSIVSGEAWSVIPVPLPKPWLLLSGKEEVGQKIRESFAHLFLSYRIGDREAFEQAALATRLAVEGQIKNWDEGQSRKIRVEAFYNQVRPFLLAWVLYLIAALLWLLAFQKTALGFTFSGVLVHVLGIAARCYVSGRPPVSNMYESMIWVMLGILIFALILYFFTRRGVLLTVACSLATLGLVIADASPTIMDSAIHPLVPVLRSNYWLTIHVLTITLSYAAFALAFGLGNIALFQYFKQGWGGVSTQVNDAQSAVGLNQLAYRAMQFGVVLLAAGTILGGVWADYSWGRFWGWDPKEVWALIALLGYLIVLHARFTGWIGQFGFSVCSVLSFLSVVMAWYGVNFVLGQGLHSYGFSSGGQGWVGLFVGLQIAYVGGVAALRSSSLVKKNSIVK